MKIVYLWESCEGWEIYIKFFIKYRSFNNVNPYYEHPLYVILYG